MIHIVGIGETHFAQQEQRLVADIFRRDLQRVAYLIKRNRPFSLILGSIGQLPEDRRRILPVPFSFDIALFNYSVNSRIHDVTCISGFICTLYNKQNNLC